MGNDKQIGAHTSVAHTPVPRDRGNTRKKIARFGFLCQMEGREIAGDVIEHRVLTGRIQTCIDWIEEFDDLFLPRKHIIVDISLNSNVKNLAPCGFLKTVPTENNRKKNG